LVSQIYPALLAAVLRWVAAALWVVVLPLAVMVAAVVAVVQVFYLFGRGNV
jgi:hypothetical protein